ncbi:MAG: hypothetical protein AAF371_17120 [Pseudomonadota bacterium]
MRTITIVAGIVVIGGLGAFALDLVDVDMTDSGELPEVSISGGELPTVESDVANVTVSSETKTVEVPDVDVNVGTEEAEISVPEISVEGAEAEEGGVPDGDRNNG